MIKGTSMSALKRLLVLLAIGILGVASAMGQTTAVTATITDSTGTVWANGSYTISFVNNPQINPPYTYQGAQFNPQVYRGTLNGSGTLSVTIPDNSYIANGTQWLFVLCPNASSPCSQITRSVTGASESFTADFSSHVTPPVFAAGPTAYGYNDSEVSPTPSPGGSYFNVTSGLSRTWSGSAWSNSGGAGLFGSGAPTNPCTPGVPYTDDVGNVFYPCGASNDYFALVAGTGIPYPAGTGIPEVTTGTSWGSTYNAGNTIPANFIPTLNQSTTGSAAKWTTARTLAGNSVDGSANVAFSNKFIAQGTADAGLSGAQFLGALNTGF